MDAHPRKFILHVNEVDVNLNNDEGADRVVLVFHGNVTPATRKRLQKAIRDEGKLFGTSGEIEMEVKRLL